VRFTIACRLFNVLSRRLLVLLTAEGGNAPACAGGGADRLGQHIIPFCKQITSPPDQQLLLQLLLALLQMNMHPRPT